MEVVRVRQHQVVRNVQHDHIIHEHEHVVVRRQAMDIIRRKHEQQDK